MLGIIVQLIISLLILWFVEKQNLSALGFSPTAGRVQDFIFGILASLGICSLYNFLSTRLVNNNWIENPEFTSTMFLNSSWWTLKSVLFEELIFRGALLYVAIRKIGLTKACILSGICFGIYHWFSFGVFGNPVPMLFIFFMTGIAGTMFAFSFAKTRSLYLPIALHFGWNICNMVIFSNGPLGKQMLFKENEHQPQSVLSLMIFIFQVFGMPLATYWYLKVLKGEESRRIKFFNNEKSI